MQTDKQPEENNQKRMTRREQPANRICRNMGMPGEQV